MYVEVVVAGTIDSHELRISYSDYSRMIIISLLAGYLPACRLLIWSKIVSSLIFIWGTSCLTLASCHEILSSGSWEEHHLVAASCLWPTFCLERWSVSKRPLSLHIHFFPYICLLPNNLCSTRMLKSFDLMTWSSAHWSRNVQCLLRILCRWL